MSEDIVFSTRLPWSTYLEFEETLEEELEAANLDIILCPDSVVETWVHRTYSTWFINYNIHSPILFYTRYERKNLSLKEDITIWWRFEGQNKSELDIGLLFKLTFGGV